MSHCINEWSPQSGRGLRGVRGIAYAAGLTQAPHAHATTSVTLVLGGQIEERVGRRTESARAMSLVVKPAGVEHANRVGPRGAHTLQVELEPRSELAAEASLSDWRWFHSSRAAAPFLAVLEALFDAPPDEASTTTAVCDVLGILGQEIAARRRPAPSWLKRVADEVDADFAKNIDVADLARRNGVHPVSLARAFRRHYAMSITERIRARRVREGVRLLVESSVDLVSVAMSLGFADHAHFCRVFRRATGFTPSALRRMACAR